MCQQVTDPDDTGDLRREREAAEGGAHGVGTDSQWIEPVQHARMIGQVVPRVLTGSSGMRGQVMGEVGVELGCRISIRASDQTVGDAWCRLRSLGRISPVASGSVVKCSAKVRCASR